MKRISFKDSKGLNLTREVLAGRKTITRRAIALPQGWKSCDVEHKHIGVFRDILYNRTTKETYEIYPKYFIGNVVAIQQSYKEIASKRDEALIALDLYKIGNSLLTMDEMGAGWNNKMFVRADLMPHHIRITDACCEWLQDISDEDCMREGVLSSDKYAMPFGIPDECGGFFFYSNPREAFEELIDKVSGRGTWKSNPPVWVYEFELIP